MRASVLAIYLYFGHYKTKIALGLRRVNPFLIHHLKLFEKIEYLKPVIDALKS